MEYKTVVVDLFARFPQLRSVHDTRFAYMGEEGAGPYVVFGSVLLPALEDAMANGDLATILRISAFLEDVAEAGEQDAFLRNLLGVEVGEWLRFVENEAQLSPWLGPKTKRICGYVAGLAAQRRAIKEKAAERRLAGRVSSLINRLWRK